MLAPEREKTPLSLSLYHYFFIAIPASNQSYYERLEETQNYRWCFFWHESQWSRRRWWSNGGGTTAVVTDPDRLRLGRPGWHTTGSTFVSWCSKFSPNEASVHPVEEYRYQSDWSKVRRCAKAFPIQWRIERYCSEIHQHGGESKRCWDDCENLWMAHWKVGCVQCGRLFRGIYKLHCVQWRHQ